MQPQFTNYTVSFKGALDHIMHNNKLRVIDLLELPKIDDIVLEQALPSSRFPSDHIRIEAKLLIV